jgi:hypothetical protein
MAVVVIGLMGLGLREVYYLYTLQQQVIHFTWPFMWQMLLDAPQKGDSGHFDSSDKRHSWYIRD